MFTSNSCFIRQCVLGSWLLVFGAFAQAVSLNPNVVENRFFVKNLSLQGFSAIDGYPLSFSELSAQLNLERGRFGEELSVDQLHQIADTVTVYVRRKGFVFHTVYLPPQKIVDGRVRYELLEGVLTDIHVLNKTKIPDRRFERVFDALLNKMLYAPDVEKRIQALKTQGGVRIFAFYSRGAKAGQARLNVRVDSEKAFSYGLKVDNFGSVTSGEYRAIARWSAKQLTRRFDRLSVAVLSSLDDTANVYGSIHYVLPTASLSYEWDVSASNNQFELGDRFEDLGLVGDSTNLAAGFSYRRVFDPARSERWRLGYFSKTNNLEVEQTSQKQEETESTGVNLQWSKALQWPDKGIATQWLAGVSSGNIVRSADNEESFSKVDANVQIAKVFGGGRYQTVLTTMLSGQNADVNLPGVESFSLTGPYGVRGFEPGIFSADTALLGSLELGFPGLMRGKQKRWYIEPFLFADWATGTKNVLGETPESEATFVGAGGGFRFGFGKHFSGQLYGASPVDGEMKGLAGGEMKSSTIDGEEVWRFELRLQ